MRPLKNLSGKVKKKCLKSINQAWENTACRMDVKRVIVVKHNHWKQSGKLQESRVPWKWGLEHVTEEAENELVQFKGPEKGIQKA